MRDQQFNHHLHFTFRYLKNLNFLISIESNEVIIILRLMLGNDDEKITEKNVLEREHTKNSVYGHMKWYKKKTD